MRHASFLLLFFAALTAFGQSNVLDDGTIFSQEGFQVLRTDRGSYGLYTADGKILVALSAAPTSGYDITREVRYGTQRIGAHALNCPILNNYAATASGNDLMYKPFFRVVLPTTVQYIHPDALSDGCFYQFVVDDTLTQSKNTRVSSAPSAASREEQARYDAAGRIINERQAGVNVVRYSDGSAEKVLEQ
ncbi:MAG: hypothetical protein IJ659_06080 [Alloprevotella sp.]|nr:hypothetical protein [Alloprevotella sp.]